MIFLKVLLVPLFILFISLAAMRWGPRVGGLLAGLPVIAGPILFLLYLEQGAPFTAQVAIVSLGAVASTIVFCVMYSHACRHWRWGAALVFALFFWGLASICLGALPIDLRITSVVAFAALLGAPHLFPQANKSRTHSPISPTELGLRMLAGATLAVCVSSLSSHLGAQITGLMTAFPIIGTVLAAFTHRSHGSDNAIVTLRAMANGLYSFVAFLLSLTLLLPVFRSSFSFVVAAGLSLLVQRLVQQRRA